MDGEGVDLATIDSRSAFFRFSFFSRLSIDVIAAWIAACRASRTSSTHQFSRSIGRMHSSTSSAWATAWCAGSVAHGTLKRSLPAKP